MAVCNGFLPSSFGTPCLTQGLLVTIAIGVHNIPEGLAKATVLVAQGVSARRALWWSVLTCLPQPLVAVPSFLFVDTFRVRRSDLHMCF